MQQATPPLSRSSVLGGWLRDLAVSMGIGAALLVPILFALTFLPEDPTRCVVEAGWQLGSEEHVLPSGDEQLEQWVGALEGIERVRSRRFEVEGDAWLELRFDAHWSSDVHSPALPDLDAFGELLEAQLPELGYGRPSMWSRSSRSPFVFSPALSGWVYFCFLLASVGFLLLGRRSWSRRDEETAGCLAPPASTKRCLLLGVPLGLVFFLAGYALFVLTGDPAPHSALWAFTQFIPPVPGLIASILAVAVVPLAQELFFRHHLYARMRAAGGAVRGALLSSILPALFLVAMPLGAALVFCQGLVCCRLYRSTGRLLAPVLLTSTASACFVALSLGLPGDLDSWLKGMVEQALGQV